MNFVKVLFNIKPQKRTRGKGENKGTVLRFKQCFSMALKNSLRDI